MFSSELKTGLMKVGDMTFHCGTSEEKRQKYKKLLRLSISKCLSFISKCLSLMMRIILYTLY